MDIPRTDSPIFGFDAPSPTPLTCPAPGWRRALPHAAPASDCDADESDELCAAAEAELESLVHHLNFPGFTARLSHRSSVDSVASSSYSSSTVCYTPSSSVLHTPNSSVDCQFNPHSLAKSRSFAKLSVSSSARRAAVYIVDDDDEDGADWGVQFPYGMEEEEEDEESARDLRAEPSSRFSFDEDDFDRPRSTNIRDLWTRSRAVSMSAPQSPPSPQRHNFPRLPPPLPVTPPSPTVTQKKNKRKTTFSMLSMLHISF